MSRLSIEIDPKQHRQIKTLATFEGMSMKDFILSKVLSKSGEQTDTTAKLLSAPKSKERLLTAIDTSNSKNVAFNSIDELEDALGI